MTGIDGEPCRIRDVVRDSKILWDVPSMLDWKNDSIMLGLSRRMIGQRHNLEHDVHQFGRDFPRTFEGGGTGLYRQQQQQRYIDFTSNSHERDYGFRIYEEKEDPFHGFYQRYGGSYSLIVRFKKNLPVFNGFWHEEDLMTWIDAIEDFFEEMNPPEGMKCKIVKYKMEGAAYYWWKQIQRERNKHGKEEINSWHRMRDLLISRFAPDNCSTKCLNKQSQSQVYNSSHGKKRVCSLPNGLSHTTADGDSDTTAASEYVNKFCEAQITEKYSGEEKGVTENQKAENGKEGYPSDLLGQDVVIGDKEAELGKTNKEIDSVLEIEISKKDVMNDVGSLQIPTQEIPSDLSVTKESKVKGIKLKPEFHALEVLFNPDPLHPYKHADVVDLYHYRLSQTSYFKGPRIHAYVNFDPGGKRKTKLSMGIYNAMELYKTNGSTICGSLGLVASMSAFILAFGGKERWFYVPNANVMFHQPLGTIGQQYLRYRRLLNSSFVDLRKRQLELRGKACAGAGQNGLVALYDSLLSQLGMSSAQLLVRDNDVEDLDFWRLRETCMESFMTFKGLFHESEFMSHGCQTLNFDPGGDLGIYNGREYRTTQMVVRFTGSMKSVAPKIWGGGNGSRVIGFTGNLLTSSDLSSLEDVAISTKQLRLRLLQEGSDESVIEDCKSIMMKELAELKDQLKVHELGASVNNEFRFQGSWVSYNFFNADLKCWSPSKQLRELAYMSNMLFKLLLEVTLKILYDVVISIDYSILCSADKWLRLHSNPLNNLSLILALVADDSLHFVGVISNLTQIISCANALDSSYLLNRLIGWTSGFAGIQDKVGQNMHMEDGSCSTRVYPKEAENELWVRKKYELHNHINHEHINGSDTFSLIISVGAKEELTTREQKLSVVGWMGNYLLLWVGWVRMAFLPFDPGGITYHLETWHTTIFSLGVKKLVIFAVPGMNETGVRVFGFGLLRNEAFDASCNDATLCCVSHLLLLSGSNLMRGQVIPLEGWDDENNANMEWNFKMVKISVVIIDSSCVKVLSNNEKTRESLKLFHTVVNGLDPPKNLDCACATSTWILKSSLEDELFEGVDGADVAN